MSDRRRGEEAEKTAQAALADFTANFAPKFAAPDLITLTSNVVAGWNQVNSSLISYAQTSLQNNLAAAEELRQVQSPKDLVDIQLRIVRRAYEDYVEEATLIGQIVQRLSAESIGTLSGRAQPEA